MNQIFFYNYFVVCFTLLCLLFFFALTKLNTSSVEGVRNCIPVFIGKWGRLVSMWVGRLEVRYAGMNRDIVSYLYIHFVHKILTYLPSFLPMFNQTAVC